MATEPEFIGRSPWWASQAGQHLLSWEQAWIDEVVSDVFGFHALQLGLPCLDGLRANRMPHRWLASSSPSTSSVVHGRSVVLNCEFDALPFPSQSLDLVVMPHTLELSRDPHLALREAERVLVPEGRLMITAFNPASWWSLRGGKKEGASTWGHSESTTPGSGTAVQSAAWPVRAQMLGFRRLRDWLRLLSFEVEAARFGRFGPRVESAVWQQRWSWVEPLGQRWWPVLGAVYGLTAVKRVRGMRWVGLAKRQARYASAPRPALVSSQQGPRRSGSARS